MKKKIATILTVAMAALSAGSLEGFHNLYEVEGSPFTTFIARKPGDILTVVIKEKASTTDTGEQRLERTNENEMTLSQFFISPFNPFNGLTKVAGGGDPLSIDYESESRYNARANNGSKMEFKTTIQVRIIEEISPGQFVIRGNKEVRLNGKDKTVFLSGTIRQRDIKKDNTIESDQIADATIEIDGELADKDTKPGFITNIFNKIF
jgi:flagellar L-ring protein precursor FlgH